MTFHGSGINMVPYQNDTIRGILRDTFGTGLNFGSLGIKIFTSDHFLFFQFSTKGNENDACLPSIGVYRIFIRIWAMHSLPARLPLGLRAPRGRRIYIYIYVYCIYIILFMNLSNI